MTQPDRIVERASRGSARWRVELRLSIDEPEGRWLLEEGGDVPESPLHDGIIEVLMLVLKEWARREGRSVLVSSNLGCRWDPADARVGMDPDVVLLEPPPPEGELLKTLRVWEPGHLPPRLAVEVVSENTAEKDYLDAPARGARLGVRELWVLDPLLVGPTENGGPYLIQIWHLDPSVADQPARLERVHAGPGAAFSPELGAYLVVVDEPRRFRIATDPAGSKLWPTRAEAEQTRAEAQQTRAEAQQTRAEAAEAEVTRLRRLLAERGG